MAAIGAEETMSRKSRSIFRSSVPGPISAMRELLGLVAKHGLHVDYRPVALGQVFPESGGLPLPKRHPSRQRYRILELQRWRDKRGLDFHLHPQFWPFDPSLADRIVCAMTQAGADAAKFIAAAFAGIFEQPAQSRRSRDHRRHPARNPAPEPHWLERGESGEAEVALPAQSRPGPREGVFGSPSYLLDGEVFWGQDRLDLLDDALTSGRKPYRPNV